MHMARYCEKKQNILYSFSYCHQYQKLQLFLLSLPAHSVQYIPKVTLKVT